MISYIWFSKYIDCSMEDLMDFAGGKVQIGATNLIFFLSGFSFTTIHESQD